MPGWAKVLTSVGTSFGVAFLTAKASGANNNIAAYGAAATIITGLGNLVATSPSDHKALGKDN